MADTPKITICIPHWQAEEFIKPCLRSIRKHSTNYDVEVIVIDNGSKDDSLDYLKSLNWIRLIERPDESPKNWPMNVFSAWDRGLKEGTGDYYITMHSDVFIKSDKWLEPFLREIQSSPEIKASGAWKLDIKHPLYLLQKRILGNCLKKIKRCLFNREVDIDTVSNRYPRDYCAMYDAEFLKANDIHFFDEDMKGGGYHVSAGIREHGGQTRVFPVPEMASVLAHIAHGTRAIHSEFQAKRKSRRDKTTQSKESIFRQKWIQQLEQDESLDR